MRTLSPSRALPLRERAPSHSLSNADKGKYRSSSPTLECNSETKTGLSQS